MSVILQSYSDMRLRGANSMSCLAASMVQYLHAQISSKPVQEPTHYIPAMLVPWHSTSQPGRSRQAYFGSLMSVQDPVDSCLALLCA